MTDEASPASTDATPAATGAAPAVPGTAAAAPDVAPPAAEVRSAVGRPSRPDLVLRLVVLAAVVFTAVQSVLVPRGLYADGAYNLWLVLNTQDYVVIGSARTFAILLNQTPVMAALTFGVRDLDALIAFYTFGVAALPVIIWIGAFLLQLRDRFYWPLVVMYGAVFLTSGFIAIGEYTFSFALVAMAVAVLMSPRPIRGWRAAALIFSSTALIVCYEGMIFLALPQIVVAVIRLWRPRLLGLPRDEGRGRWYLWYALLAACAAAGVAAVSMAVRSLNSADTNLAGALNVSYAVHNNRQWQVAAALATVLLLTPLLRPRPVRVGAQLLLAAGAGFLLLERNQAPVWLHYNTRSLAALTYFGLLLIAVGVVVALSRRSAPADVGPGTVFGTPFGIAACGLALALSTIFWSSNAGYTAWLADLRSTVIAGEGPIDIATTDLYVGERSQYSWGWTNPYLSALLQSEYGQGIVLSQVETLDTYTPISPPTSEWFFETYHRD